MANGVTTRRANRARPIRSAARICFARRPKTTLRRAGRHPSSLSATACISGWAGGSKPGRTSVPASPNKRVCSPGSQVKLHKPGGLSARSTLKPLQSYLKATSKPPQSQVQAWNEPRLHRAPRTASRPGSQRPPRLPGVLVFRAPGSASACCVPGRLAVRSIA
jgi:hypothetical protein